jgi:hypothetical protein
LSESLANAAFIVYVDPGGLMVLFLVHPVVWLFVELYNNRNAGPDFSAWILLAVLGVPLWVLIARFLAEVPGNKVGKTHFWWLIFAVFHVWGLLSYLIFEKIIVNYVLRRRAAKRLEFADRTPESIMATPFSPTGWEAVDPEKLKDIPEYYSQYMSPLSSDNPPESR